MASLTSLVLMVKFSDFEMSKPIKDAGEAMMVMVVMALMMVW